MFCAKPEAPKVDKNHYDQDTHTFDLPWIVTFFGYSWGQQSFLS